MTETKESQKSNPIWGNFKWGNGTKFDDKGIDPLTGKARSSKIVKEEKQ